MSVDVRCPRCGQGVEGKAGCRHLRWTPDRGGPVEFTKYVLETSPYTEGRGFHAGSIPSTWWEPRLDWLLERILIRLDVVDDYCFGDPVDLDLLCLDVWHRFAPEPERRLSAAQAVEDQGATLAGASEDELSRKLP